MRRTWLGREDAGGQVAVGRSAAVRGILEQGKCIQFDTVITTEQHYISRIYGARVANLRGRLKHRGPFWAG